MTFPLPRIEAVGLLGLAGFAAVIGLLAGIDPAIAIGVTFALAFLLLAFMNLAAGLVAFIVLAFLEFVLPGGSVLSLTKLAGLVITVSWLATIATDRRARIFFVDYPGATAIMVAFLVWGGLSAIWSESASATLLDFSRYLQMMTLLVITYSAIRTQRDVRWLVGAFLFGVTVTAVYALVAQPSVDPGEVRLTSTVGNANGVATFLVAGLVFAAGAALALRRAPLARLAVISATGLFMATFILTGSRSGIISLAAVLVATVAFAGRWKPQAFALSLAAGLIAVVVFVTFAPESIKERIYETTPGQVSPNEGRPTLWEVGWRMFEDEPVRGVGLGSFQATSVHYVLEPGALHATDQVIDRPEVAHNVYLQVLAEMGVIGLVLLVGVLGFPVVSALRAARGFARRGELSQEILSRALAVSFVAFLAASFFHPGQFNKILWALLGLGPVMLAASREPASDEGSGSAG